MLGTIASSVAKSAIKPGLISAGSSAIKPGLISAGSSVTNVKQAVWGALGRHALNAVTPGLMAGGATVVNDWGDPTMSGRRKAFRALGAGVAGGALGLGGAHLATKGLTKFAPKLLKGEAGHAVQAAGMGLGLGVGGLASNALIGKGTPPTSAFKSAADAVTAGATVKQAVWGKALA
ncbi:MAG: hypothetical protein KKF39_07040, partial [Nanoarchaeota archaeon]|nr:hypothetical protein [Nanoarchaeota archaeon]